MADTCSITCDCLSNVPIFSAEYTISQGISPGTGVIRCAPQGNVVNWYGFLNLSCGGDVTIPIVIQEPSAAYNTGGQEVIFAFTDTRYFWQFGEITGHYNKRLPSGDVDSETEKTPQELAELLCREIKPLTGYDITALPNDTRPEVQWDASNPAQELANLCDALNCIPNWWIDGTLTIVPKNQGDLLDGSLTSEARTLAFSLSPAPDTIKLYGAPALFQVRLPLEAVGLDTDGSWQLLDDLSYKPAGGWDYEDYHMLDVNETTTTAPDGSKESPRQLAQHSVYRSFRVQDDLENVLADVLSQAKIQTPSGSTEFKRKHVLPMRSTLADEYVDSDGASRPKPAFVGGVFYHELLDDYKNTTEGTKLDFPVSIDPRGIVHTPIPITKFSGTSGQRTTPDLWLYVAVTLQDPENRIPMRFWKYISTGIDLGSGAKIIQQADVQFKVIAKYSAGTASTVSSVTTNENEVKTQSDYYLNAVVEEYNRPDSASDQLPTISNNYRIDGAIQQITWSVICPDPGGTTIVSRGTQHDLSVLPYKERRWREKRAEANAYQLERAMKRSWER
jgi:hypothetical protein